MRTVALLVLLLIPGGSLRADPRPDKLTIATWNVEWFFDGYKGDNSSDLAKQQSPPSWEAWEWKRNEVARVIAEMRPTILCLQEVENRKTVAMLAKQLRQDYTLDYKVAFIEGEDFFTEQDVAVLSLSGLVEFSRREQSQEMRKSKDYYQLQKHLFCRFEWGEGEGKESLLLLNLHLRASNKGQAIRQRQAQLAHYYVSEALARGENVMVIGDLNSNQSFEETTPTTDIGVLRGLNTEKTNDDLADLHQFLPAERRQTHLIGKEFDRILVSPALLPGNARGGFVFKSVALFREPVIRGSQQDKDHLNVYWTISDGERDVSDHYPLLAEFQWSPGK